MNEKFISLGKKGIPNNFLYEMRIFFLSDFDSLSIKERKKNDKLSLMIYSILFPFCILKVVMWFLFRPKDSSPLEVAHRQNQQLMFAYKARLAKTSNYKKQQDLVSDFHLFSILFCEVNLKKLVYIRHTKSSCSVSSSLEDWLHGLGVTWRGSYCTCVNRHSFIALLSWQ